MPAPARLLLIVALGIIALAMGGCASGHAVTSGRSGNIPFETVSPSSLEFIRGQSTAPVVISGEPTLPRGTGRPAPAVVLIHGATVGYEPRAQTAAIGAVKEFLTTTFALPPR